MNLMLTNSYGIFKKCYTIKTGLSDFHEMTVTVMKTYDQKQERQTMGKKVSSCHNSTYLVYTNKFLIKM